MNVRKNKLASLAALGLVGGLALTACGGGSADEGGNGSDAGGGQLSGTLAGAGASSMEAAQTTWTQTFASLNPEATVTYDPVGSGDGRSTFLAGGSDFAGSDVAFSEEEIADAEGNACEGGTLFNLPVYISPIAVVYNVEGIEPGALQLSPETLAAIFAGDITSWDDERIAEDNPDLELPATDIVPVHRSDESGTTGNFTDYLSETAPDAWTHGSIEDWPVEGGQSGEGTSGMVNVVNGGDGTIGYADASRVGELGTAKIQVGEEYVEYTPEGAASVVENSPRIEGRGEKDIAVDLNRTTDDSSNYPIVLISYMGMCDVYQDQNTVDLVKEYASYVVSQEGQTAASEAAGSAPLSEGLREQAQESIDSITVAE